LTHYANGRRDKTVHVKHSIPVDHILLDVNNNTTKMKLLCCLISLILLVTVQALTEAQIEKLNKISKKCQNESGVSQEIITKARNGDWEDDPKLKRQVFCVARNAGLATESGEVVVDVLREKVRKVTDNDEETEKIINKCAVKRDTVEETVFNTFKCVMKNKPKFSPVD
jgi:CRISPR/Cas system CSM-associated protein Csm2 small subunit